MSGTGGHREGGHGAGRRAPVRAAASVDLAAVRANLGRVREAAPTAGVMAVVKADAYGHGLVPVAAELRAGGAAWLGVAFTAEALALRAAGDTGRVLAWLQSDPDDLEEAVRADVDLSAGSVAQVRRTGAAARAAGRTARLHLELDSGLSRGGARPEQWADLVAAALAEDGVRVVGLWSHLARADEPGAATTDRQAAVFAACLAEAEALGAQPEVRHLANSAATLTRPDLHYDLVRPGIALYGLSPGPGLGTARDLGLRPAMTLRAGLALVKDVPAGEGVSYGHTWTTPEARRLAILPLGYADGVPRHGSGTGEVLVAGRRAPVVGRVCMDQCVLDLGPAHGGSADAELAEGEPVVVWGPGDEGEPTADEWGAACGTIGYEIVTGVSARVPRVHLGGASGEVR